MNTIKYSKS